MRIDFGMGFRRHILIPTNSVSTQLCCWCAYVVRESTRVLNVVELLGSGTKFDRIPLGRGYVTEAFVQLRACLRDDHRFDSSMEQADSGPLLTSVAPCKTSLSQDPDQSAFVIHNVRRRTLNGRLVALLATCGIQRPPRLVRTVI